MIEINDRSNQQVITAWKTKPRKNEGKHKNIRCEKGDLTTDSEEIIWLIK